MNVFIKEFKDHIRSLIIWCAAISIFIFLGLLKFEGFQGNQETFQNLVDSLPQTIKSAFGIGVLDMTQMPGYYSIMFVYFLIIVLIHAAMLGSQLLSKEEIEKTSEFLLSKPISRNGIISSKLLAGLGVIVILNIYITIATVLIVNIFNNGQSISKEIMLLNLLMLLLQILFMLLGTAISAIAKNTKITGNVSIAIILSTYFLSVIVDLDRRLDFLIYLTPFKYFDAKYVFLGKPFDSIFFIITFAMISLFLGITYYFYNKKDILL